MSNGAIEEKPVYAPVIGAGIATIEVSDDTPIVVLPLAERRRLFRRRRHMLSLREWIAGAGIGVLGLILAGVALVSFLAR